MDKDGNNPNDLFITLVYECVNAILELHNKIGLKVDKLQPCSRPEWLVYDPIAKAFSKNNGQVTYDGIGRVNASPPRHIGELEFNDPRMMFDYLTMPKRLQYVEAMLEGLQKVLGSLGLGLNLDLVVGEADKDKGPNYHYG